MIVILSKHVIIAICIQTCAMLYLELHPCIPFTCNIPEVLSGVVELYSTGRMDIC